MLLPITFAFRISPDPFGIYCSVKTICGAIKGRPLKQSINIMCEL